MQGFNPRPRTGSDDIRISKLDTLSVFQSAPPARGATLLTFDAADVDIVSIRAPARGATGSAMRMTLSSTFQSAPPHGERPEGFPRLGSP